MSSSVKSKRALILVALAMFACAVFALRGTAQQDQERLLENHTFPIKGPLRLEAIEGKKGTVKPGEKFLDSDDWVRSLSFSLKNISVKSITFVELELEFPRSDSDPPFVSGLEYGMRPMPDGSVLADAPPPIRSGEEVVLKFPDETYAALRQLLGELKYAGSIKHVIIRVGTVIFDDGLRWGNGLLMRRDPNDPNRWVPISPYQEAGSF